MSASCRWSRWIAWAATVAAGCWPSLSASAAAERTAPVVREVMVVFKTHFDIGYTDMAASVVERYRTTMIDDALRVVDQNRDLPAEQRFVWTIPGWPMSKILDQGGGASADRGRRVEQALRDGRFAVHALPFTLHTESLEPEDLVRGLGYASRISRGLGLALPRDAKMTDVPCHTWLMATVLKHAGVDFLHIGCNSGSSSPQVPPLFWWEGPDGSRLLTMYTAEGYGTGLVPPPAWPHRTWLALIHTGDNHGPPRPDEIEKLLQQGRRELPGVKIRIGRLSDFADRLLAEKPELPVVRGDMPDTWIHGPMSDPRGARVARTIRPALAAAEALDTELRAWGAGVAPAGPAIAAAYGQSLLYGEHTWGAALSWVTPMGKGMDFPYGSAWQIDRARGRFARMEESWDEHTRYAENMQHAVRPLLDSRLKTLAQEVKADGWRVVVFNPLPWRRDGLVSIPCRPLSMAAVRSVDDPQVLPVDGRRGMLEFVARDVPPLGYRTYVPARPAAADTALGVDHGEARLENAWLRATVDPARGTLRSLVDKRSGRELLDASGEYGFGQYLYERFDADQVAAYVRSYVKTKADWAVDQLGKPALPPASKAPYRAVSPTGWQLSLEQTAVTAAAVMHAPASGEMQHAVTTRLALHRDCPYADLEVTLHAKPADPWPEAGWICLPVRAASPQFRVGRPGGVIDPAADIVPGANRQLMAVSTGLAISDAAGPGVAMCPRDSFLTSFDTPGCMKYSPDFVPRKPIALINLFNNHWSTNFRLWNEGTWTSRVRLWAVERLEPSALQQRSLEARSPLLGGLASGPGGSLPPVRSGVEVSPPGVPVTALGANPDGEGTLLRLWEMAGQSGSCTVRLPAEWGVGSVQPVNLRGQPLGQPIPVNEGSFTVALRAHAPLSLVWKKDATAASSRRLP